MLYSQWSWSPFTIRGFESQVGKHFIRARLNLGEATIAEKFALLRRFRIESLVLTSREKKLLMHFEAARSNFQQPSASKSLSASG
jgi:hypothetical protein